MSKKTRYIIIIAIIAVFAGLFAWYKMVPGKYDALATCLSEKKIIFYGSFKCSHCLATKRAFGKSAKLLPYVECTTPDGSGQNQICEQEKITAYPTWVFPDGSRITGEMQPSELAEKAQCSL